MKYKVTIMLGASHSHALREALAITSTSTILDSVVELNIGERALCRHRYKIRYLFSPTLYTLAKAIPTMSRLHILHLSVIFLARTYLYYILSSPYLTHLILDAIQMPRISKFSPPPLPKLRKLTLKGMAMNSWEAVEPLITHLATSLEYLEISGCRFWLLRQVQLPSFPCLRELRHQNHLRLFDNEIVLNGLLQTVSQITHLHLSGNLDYSRITAFPKSLQHLSVEEWMLPERIFETDPLPRLVSLSIRCYQTWRSNYHLELSSFIRDQFPGITSLHLDIPWSLRNPALVMARSQHNVRTLKLSVFTKYNLLSEVRELRWRNQTVEISTDYLRNAKLPATLRGLRLDVFQSFFKLEWSVALCSRWIDDIILPPVTGLGGSDLERIDVSFIQPETRLGREQVIRKRWIKSPNEEWQIEECP